MASISEELLSFPVKDLELSVRTTNCLVNAGLTTVGQIRDVLDKDEGRALLELPHFGRKSFNEVRGVISSMVNYRSNELLRWINNHEAELRAVMDGRAAIVPTWRGLRGDEP